MLRKMSGLFLNKYQKERLAEICPDWLFAMIINSMKRGIRIERSDGDWLITADGISLFSPTAKMTSIGEKYFTEKFEKYFLIEKGDTCLDIGACIGETTIPMAWRAYHPKIHGKTIAFEPNQLNYHYLKKNFYYYGVSSNLIYENAISGVGNRKWITMNLSKSITGHSLVSGKDRKAGTIRVSAITLNYIIEHVAKKIDFAKIDVQGAETEIFKEGDLFLANCKKLVVETHNTEHGNTKDETVKYLLPYFSRIRFDGGCLHCWN